jgi:YfiH family protein
VIFSWDAPGPYAVAFSTRLGGVSKGEFASLNLGLLTDDHPDCVAENRRRFCSHVAVDPGRLAKNLQVNGSVVNHARPGGSAEPGDGLWTDEPEVPLLAIAADCLPIALVRADGAQPAVAVLHAGRAGLLSGVVEAGAAALGGGRLAAVVGPGIGACCYEVGNEIVAAYRARFGDGVLVGNHLDLRAAAERLLRDVGVEHIDHVDLCTACDPDRFFSHRRDGRRTGRQGVLAVIR